VEINRTGGNMKAFKIIRESDGKIALIGEPVEKVRDV
jgi:hypothetical protein